LKRRAIAAQELHARLQEEFQKRSGAHCVACRLPTPTYFAGAREGANWRLAPLGECSSLCHTLAEEIAARYAARFDILPPTGR
jgi:hypothetical protein